MFNTENSVCVAQHFEYYSLGKRAKWWNSLTAWIWINILVRIQEPKTFTVHICIELIVAIFNQYNPQVHHIQHRNSPRVLKLYVAVTRKT